MFEIISGLRYPIADLFDILDLEGLVSVQNRVVIPRELNTTIAPAGYHSRDGVDVNGSMCVVHAVVVFGFEDDEHSFVFQ